MKVLLDSSTIIFSFECPNSNSRIVFDLVIDGKLKGVISEKAIQEVKNVFSLKRDQRFLHLLEMLLIKNFEVIPLNKIQKHMKKWKGKIKEKDLAHLATAKAFKLKYIVALDRDFSNFSEYKTPKQFVEKVLEMQSFNTEY